MGNLLCKQLCLISLLLSSPALLAAEVLSVIYPEVKAPYDEIFKQIVKGIEDEYQGPIKLYPLKSEFSVADTVQQLDEHNEQMVIALGKSGYQVAKAVYQRKSVAVGALPIQPNGISGVSLLAEPKVLFDSLRLLAPSVKRVAVLHTPANKWLIGRAKIQADQLGLTLLHIEVSDLKNAVAEYDTLLKALNPQTDALWLPLDPITANEQVILPKLLEYAWEHNLVLFSSKPEHAKRGALFSMFPNHYELGKGLVFMVKKLRSKEIASSVLPMDKMQLAVNLRTAAHLGFAYNTQLRTNFSIVFNK